MRIFRTVNFLPYEQAFTTSAAIAFLLLAACTLPLGGCDAEGPQASSPPTDAETESSNEVLTHTGSGFIEYVDGPNDRKVVAGVRAAGEDGPATYGVVLQSSHDITAYPSASATFDEATLHITFAENSIVSGPSQPLEAKLSSPGLEKPILVTLSGDSGQGSRVTPDAVVHRGFGLAQSTQGTSLKSYRTKMTTTPDPNSKRLLDPVHPPSNFTCQGGGKGSIQCQIGCGASGSCGVTCDVGFSCCNCNWNGPDCGCYAYE